ncbi:glycosyltransferase [Oculatella sp. FACHB-28]|uniref:glycosyltransferase family 39 protein n=1 Tax=Oculatella sp. FACHB-28 TaxID=2692845 RepID=UPI0016838E77|nr:glycosyltransferase [Oculatella sp. FACHB-28]MBD2054742.1 glycosyltransferase [Oculatella sp. FACHB-28]
MWCKLNALSQRWWFHPLLLLVWMTLGIGLRFTNLTAKPLWTDEFSTIVFSLGHSFKAVALDQIVTLDDLLQPLQVEPQAGIRQVIGNLLNESNHPPLYFVLTHWWLRLWSSSEGLVSVWGVRSLSALFGVAAIPAVFGLSWLAFHSRLIGQIAAALMAVSPFAVYLAQEARHYTLPVLWIIASLGCLVLAARAVYYRTPFSVGLGLLWVVINTLGIATHYFFVFTICAEALVLLSLGLIQSWRERGVWQPSFWGRLGGVALGTLAGGLIWLPFLQSTQDTGLTQWIYRGDRTGLALLDPLGQALAGWITMLYLLPIQADTELIVTLSGAALILLVLWTLPKLYAGCKVQYTKSEKRLAMQVLGGFVVKAIAIFLGITYLFEIDLMSAFRYNFAYFPAVIVLIAAGLAALWRTEPRIQPKPGWLPRLWSSVMSGGKRTVILIGLFSFLGGLTVVTNLGYQKTHRPDVVAAAIQDSAEIPVLVAIAHRTHGQTGRLMGIAWELKHATDPTAAENTQFLMISQGKSPKFTTTVMREALERSPRPLNLWLLNFQRPTETELLDSFLRKQNCNPDDDADSVDGYRYQLYQCESGSQSEST